MLNFGSPARSQTQNHSPQPSTLCSFLRELPLFLTTPRHMSLPMNFSQKQQRSWDFGFPTMIRTWTIMFHSQPSMWRRTPTTSVVCLVHFTILRGPYIRLPGMALPSGFCAKDVFSGGGRCAWARNVECFKTQRANQARATMLRGDN